MVKKVVGLVVIHVVECKVLFVDITSNGDDDLWNVVTRLDDISDISREKKQKFVLQFQFMQRVSPLELFVDEAPVCQEYVL